MKNVSVGRNPQRSVRIGMQARDTFVVGGGVTIIDVLSASGQARLQDRMVRTRSGAGYFRDTRGFR